MKERYNAIYLSPHLDDAALSCGGQIYQLTRTGRSVLIVTIMAGDAPSGGLSPFAQSLHDRWGLVANAAAARRQEDAAACAVLGADYLHLDLLDCIYRTTPTGQALYASEVALFGQLHPSENPLAQQLAKRLADLPRSDQLLAPLTAGSHVDHQLTRLAAEYYFGQDKLRYYEEFPYVLDPQALPNDVARSDGWQPQTIKLDERAIALRIKAIACYHSQVGTFFRDLTELEATVHNYVLGVGGERLWHRSA